MPVVGAMVSPPSVVYDLTEHRNWTTAQVTDHLTRAVAGALGITV
ncbi:hypothetical protein [Nocardia seriolae]|nr:hypothetical protein [Nocardia seriolae]WKY54776.1 hypothetical protein Q5P07_12470 [Nocardia seriolae]WNJ57029.1 hypothetical protein RMO66_26780 [Nocardia seriolae]BAW08356.1 conserved hypothetical protein [Nocardia seriolae]BEK89788.1 hypothetical protein NSERKGN1266_57390 [Nocardia seriolae]BEK94595.1 hypothetical protein NSER024013_25010 [Nocardia seriolae]